MRSPAFLLFFLPALAFAEDAETLFREGRAAADEGNYLVACPKFEESYKLDPAPGTLLNLADCEENRGQLVKAWQHFRQLHDRLPATDERKSVAATRARALEQRLPPPRDDRPTVAAAVTTNTIVPSPTATTTTTPADTRRRTTVIVLTSVGLGVATFGTFLAVAGAAQTAGAACHGNMCANDRATSQFQSGQGFTIAGDVMIGAGVALVGAAVLVLLTGSRTAPTTAGVRF